MNKFVKFLLWSLVFLGLLLACDQLLLRVPMQQPALAAVRAFYLDFRGRLIDLGEGRSPATIDQVIDRAVTTGPEDDGPAQAQAPAAPDPGGTQPHYLYVDGEGNLQFADRLEEIPARYRKEARSLAE